MSSPVIHVEHVNFAYDGHPVLEDIHLHIQDREFIALIGPNGCGKTTLLNLLLGLLQPDQGQITILGTTPQRARSHIGYVPQFATFNRTFPISVRDTVLQGRLGHTRWFGPYTRQDHRRAEQAMEEAHIAPLHKRALHTLSGGQLQRVLLARALAGEPRILMLDEPTANVDQQGETDIFSLLKHINQRMSILVVSHDVGFVSSYVHRVACLNRSLVMHNTDALTGAAIQDLYGQPQRIIHHHHQH